MAETVSGFARRFRFLRLLRTALTVAAATDLTAAAALVTAPGATARWLGLAPPHTAYRLLLAVLLAMAGVLLLAAAREIRRYSAVIAVTLGGRLIASAAVLGVAWVEPGTGALLLVGAVELALGLLLLALWRPVYG